MAIEFSSDTDRLIIDEISKHEQGIQHKAIIENLKNQCARSTINRRLKALCKSKQLINHKIGKVSIYFVNNIGYDLLTKIINPFNTSKTIESILRVRNNLPEPYTHYNYFFSKDAKVETNNLLLLELNGERIKPKFREVRKSEIAFTVKIPPNRESTIRWKLKLAPSKYYRLSDCESFRELVFKLNLNKKPNIKPVVIFEPYTAKPEKKLMNKINNTEYILQITNVSKGSNYKIVWDKSELSA